MIALSEAVVVLGSIPTPQKIGLEPLLFISHSRYEAAFASPPEAIACS
jgi:hypothetical protein